jgi:hypothetical protein
MANETFDSKPHVVIPVLHPNGSVDSIAVPHDTPIPDLHAALADYYLPDLGKSSQPTADGAVENSPAFKQRAQQAWDAAVRGVRPDIESGFEVGRTGNAGPIQTQITPRGSTPQDKIQLLSPNSLGVLHTHPNTSVSSPSPGDIAAAKAAHKTVWLTSRDGLFSVDPGGKVTRIFTSDNWMKGKTQ